MQFLLTNDDGFDAPGLAALARALAPFGECSIVAPAVCHSAKGHAINTANPVSVVRRSMDSLGEVYVVDATPADCVRIALRGIRLRPDWVVAGINPGANMGIDTYYSGTVAAAREAAMLGCPAIAISQYVRSDIGLDWQVTQAVARRCLGRVIEQSLTAGEFHNINLPAVRRYEEVRGIAQVPHSTEPHEIEFASEGDLNDGRIYRYSGNYGNRVATQHADVRYVFEGYATISRLLLSANSRHTEEPSPEPWNV